MVVSCSTPAQLVAVFHLDRLDVLQAWVYFLDFQGFGQATLI